VPDVLVLVVEEDAKPRLGDPLLDGLVPDGLAALVEGVGNVLEEDQAKDEVFVLRGVNRPAQLVRRLP
jgi:hypothetical protein